MKMDDSQREYFGRLLQTGGSVDEISNAVEKLLNDASPRSIALLVDFIEHTAPAYWEQVVKLLLREKSDLLKGFNRMLQAFSSPVRREFITIARRLELGGVLAGKLEKWSSDAHQSAVLEAALDILGYVGDKDMICSISSCLFHTYRTGSK